MTKSKALVSIFAVFAVQILWGIIDYITISSGSYLTMTLYFILRTEIFAIGAGILLKIFVGKAGWVLLFCVAGTLAALAAELFCFTNGGIMFTTEILLLSFTAPIAALYYLFTHIVIVKPKNKVLFICVTTFVTVVITAIFCFPLTYFF